MKDKLCMTPFNRNKAVPLTGEYKKFLKTLVENIRISRVRSALAASREMLALYWNIGREIVLRQEKLGWGKAVISRLSSDIIKAFPDIEGFSERNLWRMRAFYRAYQAELPRTAADMVSFLPQFVAEIPWGHHSMLLEKMTSYKERCWYAFKARECGWSRDVMAHHIETKLFHRQGKALTNFSKTLPAPHSDLARQTLKDPYLFNFLSTDEQYREKELENALINHIEQFLIELGAGFSLVGRQVRLKIDKEDFYIDLLFYHLKLRCFVVIELKAGHFKPEYAGQINFYLSAVDDLMKYPQDNPTIGLILCRTKQTIEVEYALRNMASPIGVADWQTRVVKTIPKEFKNSLPTVKEIENELLLKNTKKKEK